MTRANATRDLSIVPLAGTVSLAIALSAETAAAGSITLPTSQFPAVINVADLGAPIGFEITGISAGNFLGWGVSSAGDVNGDGLGDLVIGAPGVDAPGVVEAGAAYVLFGTGSAAMPASISASSLNGVNGFAITGAAVRADAGFSVASGDFNGDGYSDVIIGAPGAAHASGEIYVVFGHGGGFPASLSAKGLNGANGVTILGAPKDSKSGYSVASGDINGDGRADVVIGAVDASPNGLLQAGSAYVVFGSSAGATSSINLNSLNGANGFRIDGAIAGQHLGFSVTTADLTGSGYDDVIVGAPNGGTDTGDVYVIYGNAGGFPPVINVNSLNGTNGFTIIGGAMRTRTGWSVGAGDVNGDGIPDLIIGEIDGWANGVPRSGVTYVLYGSKAGFPATINLANLTPSQGFEILGYAYNQEAGGSVSCAGDINGDGIPDILVGAPHGDPIYPKTNLYPGSAFVVFGQKGGFTSPVNLDALNGVDGFRIDDNEPTSGFEFSVSAAGDINGDGFDDLIIGKRPSPYRSSADTAGAAYVIYGHSTSGPAIPPTNEMFVATVNNYIFSGGAGNNYFNFSHVGQYAIAYGGSGNAVFYMGAKFTANDAIDGGTGTSTLILDGDYSKKLIFGLETVENIQTIELISGNNYDLALGSDFFAVGKTMTIDASRLGAGNTLSFDGRTTAARDGNLVLKGGAGNDVLIGGPGNDRLIGGIGADSLAGGAGTNVFVYNSLADSTVAESGRDTILDFSSAQGDKIDLSGIAAALGKPLRFIGSNAFDGGAGEVRAQISGKFTLVYLDADGDKKPDFSILLDGDLTLSASDFILSSP